MKATQLIGAVGTVITGTSVSTSDFKQAIGRFRTPLTQNFRLAATEGYLKGIEGDKDLNAVVEEIKTRTQQQGSQEAYESMIKDLNSMIVQAAAEVLKDPSYGLTEDQRNRRSPFSNKGGRKVYHTKPLSNSFQLLESLWKRVVLWNFWKELKEVYQQKLESFAPEDSQVRFKDRIDKFIDDKKEKITEKLWLVLV